MKPAIFVIERLGGPEVVAKITGRHVSRVYRWMYPRERGGTGGIIPHQEAQKLLEHSRANGIDLKPEDFFEAAA